MTHISRGEGDFSSAEHKYTGCIERFESNWILDARNNEYGEEKFQKMIKEFCKTSYLKDFKKESEKKESMEKQLKEIKLYEYKTAEDKVGKDMVEAEYNEYFNTMKKSEQ